MNKTPSNGTLLGRTSRRSLSCWLLLLFSSLKDFVFPGYFSLPPALDPGFSDLWMPPAALSSNLTNFVCFTFARLFRHGFTASATVLRGHFIPTGVFYLTHFPQIFGPFCGFCDSDAGRNTQSRILLCAYPHRVVTYGWRMDLNYSYCNYKTIDLSIAPVSHKV